MLDDKYPPPKKILKTTAAPDMPHVWPVTIIALEWYNEKITIYYEVLQNYEKGGRLGTWASWEWLIFIYYNSVYFYDIILLTIVINFWVNTTLP